MKLSLIICTRNRASKLEATLESILSLQYSDRWELVIIDNGSTDSTALVIDDFRNRFQHELITFLEHQVGLSTARNIGWRLATGDIITFTDDDCYPAEDFLIAVTRCFKEDDCLGFIGGRILLYDQKDYPITIQEQMFRQEIKPGEFIPAGLIQGANFAFRRSALESVGGFDMRFGAGALFACEDVDVLARISAQSWFGVYDPRPVVYHHHGRKTYTDVTKLMRQYDRGRGAYYTKCILNSKLRSIYLKNWLYKIKSQPVVTSCRELIAGGEFLVRNVLFHKRAGSGALDRNPEFLSESLPDTELYTKKRLSCDLI